MSEIINSLQIMIQNCVRAMGLLDAGYATVISSSPLTLKIQASQLEVKEPVAIMVRMCATGSNRAGRKIIINHGLAAGDKVLVLKANSGQNYIVIAKV
ncbi:MAG: DUF2577 family protein [Blautia marasmi]